MPLPQKKIKYKRGFKKWSDDKAIDLRKNMGLISSAPLCAFELCEHLEIPLLRPENVPGISQELLTVLLKPGETYWSAASIPITDNDYIIIHNPIHSPARQQSDIMHEVAHILCGHVVPPEKKATGLSGFLRNHDEAQENEAEWLGACLQLPRPALLWALKKKMKMEEIGNFFQASVEMVRYRINITGVKKQLAYSKF
jgi:hypothetical protein